jgi:hypothetical protein
MSTRAFTFHDVADRLGVAIRAVQTLVAEGKLKVVYITPRTPRVPEAELARYIAEAPTTSQSAVDAGEQLANGRRRARGA